MPRKPSTESLETFVRLQDASTLADVLLELAAEHDPVRKRLERLAVASQPKALASAFRKTLAGWKRASRYVGYAEASAFGRELEQWLAQVEHELLPQDPALALDLAEAFIEADASFFERADDSDGAIGDAVRAACRLWLRCAAQCEAPSSQWPQRIVALAAADAYGARDELLGRANLLLDTAALRALVAQFEQALDRSLTRPGGDADPDDDDDMPSMESFSASAALSLLSQALQDPDVKVRAVLRYSPEPNPVQKEDFVRAYLGVDRPADALHWLQGSWAHLEGSRQRWLAQALHRLGRTDEAAAVRQQVFEQSLAVGDLQAWIELLDPAAQSLAFDRARVLALGHDDPVVAAGVLLEIDEDAAAQQALVANPAKVGHAGYGALLPMAKTLESRELWPGATVVYRALLLDILARAYSPAYRHGAAYWRRLQEIASKCPSVLPLASAEDFETEVRQRHARKSSFWALVDGPRRAGSR